MPTSRPLNALAVILMTGLITGTFPLHAGQSNAAPGQPLTSLYTDLREDRCQMLELHEAEGPYSRQRCPGVAGYRLLVLDEDARMSITVEDPTGREHPLNLWTLVGSSFRAWVP